MAWQAENPPEVGELFFGGFPSQVIEYVAQLDGLAKYWQLSDPVNVSNDYTLELKFKRSVNQTSGGFIFASVDGASYGLNLYMRGDWTVGAGEIYVFGMSGAPKVTNLSNGVNYNVSLGVSAGVAFIEVNGVRDEATVFTNPPALSSSTSAAIGAKPDGSFKFEGFIYDFVVSNGVNLNIPLTNKDQGATQLATVGTINATMIGYTGNEWVDRSTL